MLPPPLDTCTRVNSSASDARSSFTPSELQRLDVWMENSGLEILEEDTSVEEDIRRCLRAFHFSSEVQSFGVARQRIDLENDEQTPPQSEPSSHAGEASPAPAEGDAGCRFSRIHYVGHGAFGVVFFAYDRSLGIEVAIKLLRPSQHSPRSRRRFFDEARIMAKLPHPGIARIFDTGFLDGIPYITSSKANGGSLAMLLRDQPNRLDPASACQILLQVAKAAYFAHNLGVFHRDIKPGNILLHRDEADAGPGATHAILTDFGLAKRTERHSGITDLTQAGDILGTTRYMSPEQARGELEQFGATSEIFTLGVILFEMLTGQVPFHGKSNGNTRQQILHSAAARPSHYRPGLPRELDAIVLKCLEKAPEHRYRSASDLSEDLSRFLNHEPVKATNPTWMTYVISATKRNPAIAGLSAVACLILAASTLGIGLAWYYERQATLREQHAKSAWMTLCGKMVDDIRLGAEPQEQVLKSAVEESAKNLELELRGNPQDESTLHQLSVMLHYVSVMHQRLHHYEEDIDFRLRSCKILRQLTLRFPKNDKYRFQFIFGCMALGNALSTQPEMAGRYERRLVSAGLPVSAYDLADAMSREIDVLLKDFPENAEYCDAAATFKLDLGERSRKRNLVSAVRMVEEAIQISQELMAKHPQRPTFAKPAFLGFMKLAAWSMAAGDARQARQQSDRAMEFYLAHLKPFDAQAWVQDDAIVMLQARVEILIDDRDYALALAMCDECSKLVEALQATPSRRDACQVWAFRLDARRYFLTRALGRTADLPGLEAALIEKAKSAQREEAIQKECAAYSHDYPMPESVRRILNN